jgi:hypothetical protein
MSDCMNAIRKACREVLTSYPRYLDAAQATGLNATKIHRIISRPNHNISVEDAQKILAAAGKTLAVMSYNINPISKDIHETAEKVSLPTKMEATITGRFTSSP